MILQSATAESGFIWHKFEFGFESIKEYENPIYDVQEFYAEFSSPSGRKHRANGFWDGGTRWKIRFMPDETGIWTYRTICSDGENEGLHGQGGSFECTPGSSNLPIYQKGPLRLEKGSYHLEYADGTPFFWLACTAWNGGLKSTDQEWNHYLERRAELGYNVIQMVVTQWRGCSQNSRGDVAFTGAGRIQVNPEFFQLMDKKIDEVNQYGHVAALVMLWTLPFGEGRELSPGYYLPDQEAILLARYIISRYQGNHISWVLGGDGQYYDELEDRWKFIGAQAFRDDPQGLVTLHPHGRSWIGEIYDEGEEWFDFVGYQSTHGTTERHVNFINQTIAAGWRKISPKPVINMEPCYEQIRNEIFADDVRNACYWSIFATPPSGITYGADGIWPWLRAGEKPENHTYTPEVSPWDVSLELPGSKQIAYLGEFFRDLEWWDLKPGQGLLLEQPGMDNYKHHISMLKSAMNQKILVYFPAPLRVRLLLPHGKRYAAEWFDPVGNVHQPAMISPEGRVLEIENPYLKDAILVLTEN